MKRFITGLCLIALCGCAGTVAEEPSKEEIQEKVNYVMRDQIVADTVECTRYNMVNLQMLAMNDAVKKEDLDTADILVCTSAISYNLSDADIQKIIDNENYDMLSAQFRMTDTCKGLIKQYGKAGISFAKKQYGGDIVKFIKDTEPKCSK